MILFYLHEEALVKSLLDSGGFPGGKQDDGESLQECLERELFEGRGVVLTKYACQWLGMNSTEREIYQGHVQI